MKKYWGSLIKRLFQSVGILKRQTSPGQFPIRESSTQLSPLWERIRFEGVVFVDASEERPQYEDIIRELTCDLQDPHKLS